MLRSLTKITSVATLLVCSVQAAVAQDSLQNIFGNPAPEPEQSQDKLTTDSIPELLKEVGLHPKKIDGGISRVTVRTKDWNYQVSVFLSKDQSQFWLVFSLMDYTSSTTKDQLVGLMKLTNQYGPGHFAIDHKNSKIYLQRNLDNKNITAKMVEFELNYMKQLADLASKYWAGSTSPAPQTSEYVGRYHVTQGKLGSMDADLQADNTFTFTIHEQDGQIEVIEGRYEVSGDTLTFTVSTGEVVVGTITKTETGYRFQKTNSSDGPVLFARR